MLYDFSECDDYVVNRYCGKFEGSIVVVMDIVIGSCPLWSVMVIV